MSGLFIYPFASQFIYPFVLRYRRVHEDFDTSVRTVILSIC